MSETFTDYEVRHAISQFLAWGEMAFARGEQKGYFSGDGFAARCLRFHLNALETSALELAPVPVCAYCGHPRCMHFGTPSSRVFGCSCCSLKREAAMSRTPSPRPEMARAKVTPVCPKCGGDIAPGRHDWNGVMDTSCPTHGCGWKGWAPHSMPIPVED